jgi:cation diffusion facilitator family transporter
MNINAWLFNKFLSNRKITRKFVGYLEAWISILGNLILFIIKFLFGTSLNSISLIAEAFHSLSDVLTSIVVLLGFKMGDKPPDKEHPYGHGRLEQIATIIIAIMLLIVSYDLIKDSLKRILSPQKVSFNYLVLIFMILSALFKEWMARFSIYLGKKINSSTLIADAWHHRSDAIASILVGIGLIFVNLNLYFLDGILGIGVSLLLAWIGVELLKSSSSFLIGEAPNEELLKNIEQIVLSTPGVLNMHDLMIHDYQNNKIISLHVEIDENLSAKDAHKIALEVQDKLKKKIENSNISVHIDPKGERED